MKTLNIKLFFVYSLFVLAFLERTIFNLGPNVELVTLATVIAAFYLDFKKSIIFTFLTLIASDLVIGNSNIFLFTWSGFLIPLLYLKYFKNLKLNKIYSGTLAGISSNLFFFIWTNFGVWLLDSWGMYPKTFLGLVSSYINGLPFLKNQLLSGLMFIPLTFLVVRFLPEKIAVKNFKFSLNLK